MKKIIIYVDGSNFYFSLKTRFKTLVDINKFCKKLSEGYCLIKIKYYIAPVEQLKNLEMYAKQQSFFDKLRENKDLKIVFGRLEKRKQEGDEYYIEKATDVNLALDLVLDAQANKFDEAFLISNDGDFSGAVKATIKRFNKKVNYVAIGTTKTISYHLKRVSSRTIKIDEDFISDIKI